MAGRLTDKQKRFCEEYLVDLNATQAYVRAGYSTSDAHANACRMLSNAVIQAYIAKLRAQQSDRTAITADRVLEELAAIGFTRITDVVSFSEDTISIKDSGQLSDNVVAAIAEVTLTDSGKVKRTSVKMHDKMQALKMLAEHLGMYSDFEGAVKTLANKYGLFLIQSSDGNWIVENRRVSADSQNIITENPAAD